MSAPKLADEVSELLELVCGKSSESKGEDKVEVISIKSDNEVPLPPMSSGKIQILENIIIPNPYVEPQILPMDTEGDESTIGVEVEPELEPRAIESNALKMIAQYGSDSDSSESEFETESESESSDDVVEVSLQKTIADGNYRVVISESEESTSSDDSDCEVISVKHEIINLDDDDLDELGDKRKGPIRAEGEFTIDSLPPIEDLKITVQEEECVVLGKIMSIVDQLVVVDSIPGTLPIDIDSVLFLEKGTKPLGHVFDVLGNVSSPMYCVRFNSNQQIQEKGITVGQLVYVAPRTEHTSFVVVSALMKDKGCDASWKDDIESQATIDFSDDEEEQKARRLRRGRNNSCEMEPPSPFKSMEEANNRRNPQYRLPRRLGRGRGRGGGRGDPGGRNHGRNYSNGNRFDSPSNHSWHHNVHQRYRTSPMESNSLIGSSFPRSLLLPPPPPPPPPRK